MQIKIPKNNAAKQSDRDDTDHIQSMKQNIELMNQIYKNLYALYEDDFSHKYFGNKYVTTELLVEREMIKCIMWVPASYYENLEKMISSFYPWAVIEYIEQPKLLEWWKYFYGGEMVLTKNTAYPIKTYETFEADPMDSLFSAYSRVLKEEKLCLQILVSPLKEQRQKKLRKSVQDIKDGNDKHWFKKLLWSVWKWLTGGNNKEWTDDKKNDDLSGQQTGDLDKKIDDELFETKIRVLATSPESHRPKTILTDLISAFNQYNYLWLNSFWFEPSDRIYAFIKSFSLRSFFSEERTFVKLKNFNRAMVLNIKELSSLFHFPHSRFNRNPRLVRQKYKIVPAPDNTPQEWVLLGYNLYWWVKKEVRVKPMDRFRHFYTIGQTGTGKSTMMETMAVQDMRNGSGMCVIDPHGQLCDHLLPYIPKERIDDLIYFDLANSEYPIAFNVFEATSADERDIVTNDLVEMFENMYGKEIFWPRIQDYFRNASLLLMEQPEGWTMPEIMRLFTDEAFLDTKLKHLTDPVVQARRNKTYKSMGDREKKEMIPFFQAKFGQFTTWTYVRNVIGQPKSAFNFGQAMQEGKIILCNLSKWLTGEINSQLIGRMFAIQIKLHALKRAAIEEDERVPFYLYVDEFQNYVSQSFESILSEARKYRLWLAIAHQYIDQLKASWLWWNMDLSKAIFGNIGSQLYLKVWPEDAEFLEKNVQPEFSKQDLISMDRFKGIMTLSIDTQPSRPFSIAPYFILGEPVIHTNEKVEIIKQISALTYGTKRELAEKEIYYRVWV